MQYAVPPTAYRLPKNRQLPTAYRIPKNRVPKTANKMTDQPISVRSGEELPLEALASWLRGRLPGFQTIEDVRQFPGGFSNLTYFLQTDAGAFVLRRPPFGADIKSAHDMGREFRVLSLLRGHFDKIPAPAVFCEDADVIGAPFYLMERVQGLILRNRPPKDLALTPELMRRISEATVDTLAELHALDLHATGLLQMGKPEGYVERQTAGWIARYYKAETDTVDNMNAAAEWMQQHRPPDGPPAFIHNDFKYDNVVLDPADPGRIIAVLDWEMATVGDPLMDLGTSLAYWTEPREAEALQLAAANLTWLPGNLNRAQVMERYAEKSGRSVDQMLFYYVFGAFKIGVIVQQIYARYKKGHTQDPRFAGLLEAVKYFGRQAVTAIDKGQVSNL